METIALQDLRAGISFTGDLLLDSTFILLPRSADVNDDLIKELKQWNYETMLCDGNISLGEVDDSEDDKIEEQNDSSKEKIGENVKKVIENTKNIQLENSDKARMEMVQQVYDEYMNYIEQVFTHYATHKEIDQEELSETVQELCIFIKNHKRFLLRITPTTETCKKNFLVIHSMRSTVLAISIGLQLHLPLSKMIELGVTCILHEIGMLRLPPQLYMSTKKLSAGEKAQISKHTLFGYSIIKDLEFSLPIQLGVLEHHEKENGTGYPRRLTGDKISSNAKIIAVACTYEAISSPRSYKDERSTFDALLEMIQNKEHQYDDAVLKALLYTVSLYPIGTYVFLSNRKVAEVIDTNPDNPKCPVVQLITETESDGLPKVVQTGTNDISILRILSKQEKMDILKLMAESTLKKENSNIGLEEVSDSDSQKTTRPSAEAAPAATPKQVSEPAPAPEPQKPAPVKKSTAPISQDNPEGTEEVDISLFS